MAESERLERRVYILNFLFFLHQNGEMDRSD